jgi:peptide methionine sulfoxide reductase MsrB
MMASSSSAEEEEEQCYGRTPMPSVSSFLGSNLSYSTAERICCNNHRYAEYRGYLEAPEVDLFGKLDPHAITVFYDSVCGIPLFVAPRGRSFDDFKEESLKHGWPSFRPEEMVSENVIVHDDGRMESRCLTHLGHNLPEGGEDRYCIDLVCVAGAPLPESDERASILTLLKGSVIEDHELNVTAYESSAPINSGKSTDGSGGIAILVGAVFASALVVAFAVAYVVAWKKGREEAKEVGLGRSKADDEIFI